jgi:hypothetical protein
MKTKMKNYRIKRVTERGKFDWYFPQKRIFGLFWVDMTTDGGYKGFLSYENANKALCSAIAKPKVEYLDVDSEGYLND